MQGQGLGGLFKQGADLPAPGGSLGSLGAGLWAPQHGASSLCLYANFDLWTLVTVSSGEGPPRLFRLSRGPGPWGLWLRHHCLWSHSGPGLGADRAPGGEPAESWAERPWDRGGWEGGALSRASPGPGPVCVRATRTASALGARAPRPPSPRVRWLSASSVLGRGKTSRESLARVGRSGVPGGRLLLRPSASPSCGNGTSAGGTVWTEQVLRPGPQRPGGRASGGTRRLPGAWVFVHLPTGPMAL